MGYYTMYELEAAKVVRDNNGNIVDFDYNPESFTSEETSGINDEIDKLETFFGDSCIGGSAVSDQIKWYDHDEDMLRISSMFHDVMFDLYGVGEHNEDIWHTYYCNGKMQFDPAFMKFEGFDERKLTEKQECCY